MDLVVVERRATMQHVHLVRWNQDEDSNIITKHEQTLQKTVQKQGILYENELKSVRKVRNKSQNTLKLCLTIN